MNQTIFVIVKVSYDYFRFQRNVGATTDIEEAKQLANQVSKEYHHPSLDPIPVIESEKESDNMGASETSHVWIQKFEGNGVGNEI